MAHAKAHRLPVAAYRGPVSVVFTACIADHGRPFRDAEVVAAFVELLELAALKFGCLVPVYVFMPNHLHLMITGQHGKSRPKDAMDEFKRLSGMWFGQNCPGYRWQKNYYDHIVRLSEDWRAQVLYIALNPVRASLATEPLAYPFLGSIGYDLKEILIDAAW